MNRLLAVLAALLTLAAAAPPPKPDNTITYIRGHAGDAVKWQSWGKAAFDRARQQNKVVALAVGSFAPHSSRVAHAAIEGDPRMVDLLNGTFVPVLLDHAEYPLIASAYARASGQEDTSDFVVYLVTPDYEWLDMLRPSGDLKARLGDAAQRWSSDRDALLSASRLKVRVLRLQPSTASRSAQDRADPEELTRLFHDASSESRETAADTLRSIDRSALYDLLGGGFYRAARDTKWTMPYFDKTLDDQARLALVHLEAAQILGDAQFADVARATLEYAVRDLQMRSGGINASQQSDSFVPLGRPVLRDGAAYLWDEDEIARTFGPKIGARLIERFGVLPAGNISPSFDPEQIFAGKNLLRPAQTEAPDDATAAAIAKMLDIRLKRPAPPRDEPVASSHALMTAVLARAGMVLGEERFVRAAVSGGLYLERTLYDRATKRLSRRPGIAADADDYASAVAAFIAVYETTFDAKWLDLAIDLQSQQDALFWNASASRYEGAQSVPEPVRDFVADFAALNASSQTNLRQLAAITSREDFRQRAVSAPMTRVIVFGKTGHEDLSALMHAAQRTLDPARVVLYGGAPKRPAPRNVAIGSLQPNPDGSATAYVCRPGGCSDVFTAPEALAAALK